MKESTKKEKSNPWSIKFNNFYESVNQKIASNSQPKMRYAIAFTPRSGSTWLNKIIQQTDKTGAPREWFNPKVEAVKERIKKYQVNNVYDYYELLKANKKGNDMFGLEITWFQANTLFDYLNDDKIFDDINIWFWLKRRDFVAQGISLFKAVESGKFHSYQEVDKKEVVYDNEKIKKWILHVIQQEYFFNEYFKKRNIQPSELWYEDMMKNKLESINFILNNLSLEEIDKSEVSFSSELKKIGNKQSEEMIYRFKLENKDFHQYWSENRKKKKLADYKKFIKNN